MLALPSGRTQADASVAKQKTGAAAVGFSGAGVQEVIEQVFPLSSVKKTPGFDENARNAVVVAATTRRMPEYTDSSCGKAQKGPGIGKQIGATSLNIGVSTGLAAIPFVGAFLAPFGGFLTSLFGKSVEQKNEKPYLCAYMPKAQQLLDEVDKAFLAGQIAGEQALAVLEDGYEKWSSDLFQSQVLQATSKKCNAACVYQRAFRANIEIRRLDYAGQAAQIAATSKGFTGGQGLLSRVKAFFTGGEVSGVQKAGIGGALLLPGSFIVLGVGVLGYFLWKRFRG